MICLAVAAASLLTTACKEKMAIRTFGGEMEQLDDGSKNYLGHHEQWIYWEEGDDIKVDVNGTQERCELVSGHQSLTANFRSENELPDVDDPVYAIYPANSFGSSYTDLIFPATMPYRTGTATHPDSSFGIGCLPMVAYEASGYDATIYFHAVSGVLRLQFYCSSGTHTISSIEFNTDGYGNKKLSGHFTVNDITTNQPYLTTVGSPAAADKKITITNIDKQIGPTELLTFYLPLPAITSASTTTEYHMKMTVKDNTGKQCCKVMKAYIHRRNISMMPALDLTEFVSGSGDGDAQVKIVGSGTKDRPFQIYTGEELKMVRDAFNNGTKLNGQTIRGTDDANGPTYFKIVRSDIKLVTSTQYDALSAEEQKHAVIWDGGIDNFRGYMYYSSSTSTEGTIENNSGFPIFASIAANGTIEGIYVSGTQSIAGSGRYSPLCHTNHGTMIDCHNLCNVTVSTSRTLGGICAVNNGTITGGANQAALTCATGNVGGLCAYNSSTGTIQGSFTLSSAIPVGLHIGGICYENAGSLVDCQVSASLDPLNSTGDWGVIVYENNGGTVDNCRSTGSIVITTSGSIGGICHTMTSGSISNCTNNVTLNGAADAVGGIVSQMTGGEVYNCTASGAHAISGTASLAPGVKADNAGGIVGYLKGGAVRNCYARCLVQGATNSGGILGNMDGGATVENCWCDRSAQKFLGAIGATGTVGDYCFSANGADFATGCNTISTPYYTVSASHIKDASDNTLYVDEYLFNPLNAWVTAHDSKYAAWTTTYGENIYPIFNTSAKGKGKARRQRR